MRHTVEATPEALFAEATAFMVENGATVGSRTENSLTFSARQGVGGVDQALVMLTSLWDLGAAMSATTTHAAMQEQSSTLVAIPAGDGTTTVTISDNEDVASALLRFWFKVEVLGETPPQPKSKPEPREKVREQVRTKLQAELREEVQATLRETPTTKPLMKLPASYHKVLIWHNRVEAYSRVLRWKLDDTINMEDIASVETEKRLVTVRSRDGREISIKALVREDAQKAEALIQERMTSR
jgi:hypothetical protein